MDSVDAIPHREIRLRHASPAGRLVVCGHAAAVVGLVRPPRSAVRQFAAVDGHRGEPRDRGVDIPQLEAFCCIQSQVGHAILSNFIIQPFIAILLQCTNFYLR